MKYFLDNLDEPWAIDENGNEFAIGSGGKMFPVDRGSIDPMWCGIDESEIAEYVA